ncbi:PREDICTED: uncharacterized protein LOC109232599 [Nicotiana attenuata]|uniref:uncharacterized protein LOC109232599 n=1 Tax=Nicotiana attenuata TaxID=49451 RepID=UPI0009059745|nr:PREDICTED: uncharacterized protein LOC109232599 [Nicotiana attenuata]
MTPLAFTDLCEMLVREGDLRPTLQATVEEQVAKTLYLLAHNTTNRELAFIFRRSGESWTYYAYRGERYRLKEYSRNPPRNPRELFNLRHASLRNAIERAFRVLKKRFHIISSSTEPSYGVETQKLIIFSCCILHNYLRGADPNDELLAQVDAELMNDNDVHEEPPNPRESNREFRRGELIRDGIAADMWTNYQV